MAWNRYYDQTKYASRADAIRNGVKCVFISYQRGDLDSAVKVAEYLENAGIDIYFDRYDGDLKIHHQNNDPKKVTQSICAGINNSSHMLAIVSPNTITSSWVPFEVGYGFDKTDLSVLCLKGIPKGGLPEYLRMMPIIRDIYDLNARLVGLSGKSEEILLNESVIKKHDNILNSLRGVMDSFIVDNY